MISIARIFGAPVTDPPGSVARKSSIGPQPAIQFERRFGERRHEALRQVDLEAFAGMDVVDRPLNCRLVVRPSEIAENSRMTGQRILRRGSNTTLDPSR